MGVLNFSKQIRHDASPIWFLRSLLDNNALALLYSTKVGRRNIQDIEQMVTGALAQISSSSDRLQVSELCE